MNRGTAGPAARVSRWRRIPGPPSDATKARLLRIYAALLRRFGPQRWWPGRTPYEVAVGALLAQHTAWTNAAQALEALRGGDLLRPQRVSAVSDAELERAVRSAGTYRIKARRVRAFTDWLLGRFGGRFAGMRRAPLASVRAELLRIPGVGPETADSILLYAAGRPVFVVDEYARRVSARHRLLPRIASYEEARAFFETHLPSDPALFNEYHALLVAVGKAYCRAVPLCAECPLRPDLRGRPPASTRPRPTRSSPVSRATRP